MVVLLYRIITMAAHGHAMLEPESPGQATHPSNATSEPTRRLLLLVGLAQEWPSAHKAMALVAG